MEVPRMTDVKPIEDMNIIVHFDNGVIKKYNVKRLISKWPVFKELQDDKLFKSVRVDVGGFGIVWNENIDLAEYEIWTNGEDYTE